ncbi:IS701 family transposase [Methylobacterium nodulans]|uniref:IS701 family transposase n=1 Tax=Methylobacterium nodulans TaxID=114616 RepID=UPI0002E88B07|nr:transposase [Methylobacterium nodulans]
MAACFPCPTFANLMVLVAGAVLAPGRRTVTAALSRLGLREGVTVSTYHRVLSRRRWRAQATARGLLGLLTAAFAPSGPVVVGIDETIERRWGARIKARGIDRDPVRSSHGHFVKASGLRWISRMLLAPLPFAQRVWALPFLTALAPSERSAKAQGRRHKQLTDWARQLLLLLARWLPGRKLIVVAETSYAAIALLTAVGRRLTLITRLRLDARLFDPPPPRRTGTTGRPRVSGARQPTLLQRLANAKATCAARCSTTAGARSASTSGKQMCSRQKASWQARPSLP